MNEIFQFGSMSRTVSVQVLQTNIAANFPLRNKRAVRLSLHLQACEAPVRLADTHFCPGETPASPAQASFLALSDVWLTPANELLGDWERL